MIEVYNLRKSYTKDGVVADVLRDVTFSIGAGELVAIMGVSGSGKSTLLNMLGLLDRPDSGSYRLNGVDYSNADDATMSDARNRTIGFVFQQFHLLDQASALRNVMLPLLYAAEDVRDGESRALRALEAVGLAHRQSHRPGELSGGEQQRVAIARALINNPNLLLADEPTGNLDERTGEEILALLEGLRDAGRGRTVVIVTHDKSVAARADRILHLLEGRIEAGGAERVASATRAAQPSR